MNCKSIVLALEGDEEKKNKTYFYVRFSCVFYLILFVERIDELYY